MNTLLRLLIGGSIALNLVLAAVVLHGVNRLGTPAAPVAAAPAPKATAPAAPQWSELQSDDPQALLARLDAAGFPPALVRAIAAAQIRAQFAARRKALETDAAAIPYWKTATPDPKREAALRALRHEEQKAIRDLLGADPDRGDLFGFQDQALATLPPAKAVLVRDILRDFGERRQDFFASFGEGGLGIIGPGDVQKLREFDRLQHAELAKVLTPAELENYDLFTSSTAQSMRYQLAAFQPTEEEFRAIFRLQSAFDEQYRDNLSRGPEQARARMEAQQQLAEQIKLALGAERAAQYQKTSDYSYVQTSRLVARLQLPPETTDQLYAVQKDFEARAASELRSLPAEQRAAAAAKLQQEAIERITPLLGGDRGVQAYKRYGGTWLSLGPVMGTSRQVESSVMFLGGG